jgi:predicted nucleotidyltransferase
MDKNEIILILRSFKQKFAQQYGITALGVFGSVARGQSRDDSDVDVCIKTVTPDPFLLVHIKEGIEQSVHHRVDIVRIRDKMNPFLKERIDKECIYV